MPRGNKYDIIMDLSKNFEKIITSTTERDNVQNSYYKYHQSIEDLKKLEEHVKYLLDEKNKKR